MKRIGNVFKPGNRVSSGNIYILIPMRAAYHNQIVFIIFSYFWYHLQGIILHGIPGCFGGFIPYLVDHIRNACVFLGHLSKKSSGLFGVLIAVVIVPVY